MFLAKNDVNSRRPRHIDIAFHYIRDLVKKGIIILKYVVTESNIADVMTKALGSNKFKLFRQELGVKEQTKES